MYIRLSKAVKKKTDMNLPKEYELLNVRGHIDIPAEVRKSLFDGKLHGSLSELQIKGFYQIVNDKESLTSLT